MWIEIQDSLQHLFIFFFAKVGCFVFGSFVYLFVFVFVFLRGGGGKLIIYMYTIITAMLEEEKSLVVFSLNLTIIKLEMQHFILIFGVIPHLKNYTVSAIINLVLNDIHKYSKWITYLRMCKAFYKWISVSQGRNAWLFRPVVSQDKECWCQTDGLGNHQH